jgi:hypothetical protein
MGAKLGDQGSILMATNLPRAAGNGFGRERAGVVQLANIVLDRGERDRKRASGAGFGHPSLDRSHDPLAQICRVSFHTTSLLLAKSFRKLL